MSVSVYLPPVDGIPVQIAVKLSLELDRRTGVHARITTLDGHIEWTCAQGRAWTLYPVHCHVESSCDESIRRWFDIGWGYDELAQFMDGGSPTTPGWTVKHRRSRKRPMPVSSVLRASDGRSGLAVVIWGQWEPAAVDLASAIERARAAPPCASIPPSRAFPPPRSTRSTP